MSTASTADNRPYLKFYTQGRIFQLPTTAQRQKFLDRVGMSTASTAKKCLSAEFLQTVRNVNCFNCQQLAISLLFCTCYELSIFLNVYNLLFLFSGYETLTVLITYFLNKNDAHPLQFEWICFLVEKTTQISKQFNKFLFWFYYRWTVLYL